jgi:hypothetical protein
LTPDVAIKANQSQQSQVEEIKRSSFQTMMQISTCSHLQILGVRMRSGKNTNPNITNHKMIPSGQTPIQNFFGKNQNLEGTNNTNQIVNSLKNS